MALRLAVPRGRVEPVAASAPRRVVLLAATPAGLEALERAIGARDDVQIVARVTRVDDAVAADADLVIAQPAALAATSAPPPGVSSRTPADDGPLPEALTPRELDVLGLLAEGRGNRDIATTLGISEHTVKFHVGSILAKLGASSRTEAVTLGVRQGLIML